MNHDEYVAAKQAGICTKCGAPAAKGKIYCPECTEKIAFRQHIGYIRRKYGVSREEALEIYKEGGVQRFKREGHVVISEPKASKKKTPPKPKQTLEEISKLAKEASESEQHYVSYGEMAARQSGAYDWKIGRKK